MEKIIFLTNILNKGKVGSGRGHGKWGSIASSKMQINKHANVAEKNASEKFQINFL